VIRANVNSWAGMCVRRLGLVDFYDRELGAGNNIPAFVTRGKDATIGAFERVKAGTFLPDDGHGEDNIFYAVFT
jgi:hypothetical protein